MTEATSSLTRAVAMRACKKGRGRVRAVVFAEFNARAVTEVLAQVIGNRASHRDRIPKPAWQFTGDQMKTTQPTSQGSMQNAMQFFVWLLVVRDTFDVFHTNASMGQAKPDGRQRKSAVLFDASEAFFLRGSNGFSSLE